MFKFAINGFGRIGRSSARVWLASHRQNLELVAINTSGSLKASGWAYLLKYDTAYGPLPYQVTGEDLLDPKSVTPENSHIGNLHVKGPDFSYTIPVLAQRDPSLIKWADYGANIIIEATGVFTTKESASKHLIGGATHVVISAPAKGDDVETVVLGVNDEIFTKDKSNGFSVVSNASCTTNCVSPVAAVMQDRIGVIKAMLLTVHGYTDDQNLQDNSHKDLRRSRAAASNIVPTSTGAAIAATYAIPELKGLFDGLAIRVPVITGSLTDFTFITTRSTSVEEINEMFIDASRLPRWHGILAVTDEPLVSSDIIGRSESAIVDLSMTRVVDGDMVKVLAWYDNEWGYTNRLVEQVLKLAQL